MLCAGKMSFIECQSLKQLTLVRISTLLWKQHYVDDLIQTIRSRPLMFSPGMLEIKFPVIENCVQEDVRKLSLPNKLKYEVSCYIRPIGVEIIAWTEYEDSEESDVFRNACWTPQGTIDKRKSAKAFIKDQSFHLPSRYKLACNYCLESDIGTLWDQMTESQRTSVFSHPEYISIESEDSREGIVYFWCSVMEGSEFRLPDMIENRPEYTPHQYAFEYAAIQGDKAAAEYFLQKLTAEEKLQALLKAAKGVTHKYPLIAHTYLAEVLCFLLSRMGREQQIVAINENPCNALVFFLDWPWYRFFVVAANLVMWDKLREHEFLIILKLIVRKVTCGCEDYNYRELFEEVWRRGLPVHKKYMIIRKWNFPSALLIFFMSKDENSIKRILTDATSDEKQKLLFYHSDGCVCHYLFSNEIWGTFKIFVHECIPNTNEMKKFKDGVKNHVSLLNDGLSGKMEETLNAFFEFLDIFHDNKKRSAEGDDDISPQNAKHRESSPPGDEICILVQ